MGIVYKVRHQTNSGSGKLVHFGNLLDAITYAEKLPKKYRPNKIYGDDGKVYAGLLINDTYTYCRDLSPIE